jgi:hypothetical protein
MICLAAAFLAPGVGRVGPLEVDSYPRVFRKDLVVHVSAHAAVVILKPAIRVAYFPISHPQRQTHVIRRRLIGMFL